MCLKTVFLPKVNTLKIKVDFASRNFKGPMAKALIDTGATHNFMMQQLVKEQDCLIQKLSHPELFETLMEHPTKEEKLQNMSTLNYPVKLEISVGLETTPSNSSSLSPILAQMI